eukprot:scaffold149_cov383-Prasinococcus_capsulatus_cf.AAC.30
MAEKVRQLAADVRRNRDMNNTEVRSARAALRAYVVSQLRFLKGQIKLTLSIEDPRIKAKRDVLGIEDERGASRDEVAGAFQTVRVRGLQPHTPSKGHACRS